jgi:hypothetical protein
VDFDTYRPIAKKLVRFVDFDVQPGHKYRYKVQLALEDPNRPKDPEAAPEITTLEEKVRERVKLLDIAEAKRAEELKRAGKDPDSVVRKYWIVTPMSEPSEVATMPSTERFYAGETVPAPTINIAGATITNGEPQAKVLSVVWDPAVGVFAPAEQTVHRGSVLNTKADVEVLHPVLGDLRRIEEYEMNTNGVVLDILGGEKVPGTSDSKVTVRAPGETLIMDANGNLHVADESRDVEGYRKYIFPEPKEDAKEKGSKTDSMADGMAPPMNMPKGGPPPGAKGGPPPGAKGGMPGGYPSGKGMKSPKGAGKAR